VIGVLIILFLYLTSLAQVKPLIDRVIEGHKDGDFSSVLTG
jgi:hypothetical protein